MHDDESAVGADSTDATQRAPSRRFGVVTRNLTLVNITYTVAALVTGPLQAHALGAGGRGELAAVAVVLGLVATLGDFGLGAFGVRESARGRPVRVLIGSIGAQMFVLGIIYVCAAPFVASFIADGRNTVEVLLLIALVLSPLFVPAGLTTGIVWGQQRWGTYIVQRLALPVGTLIVFTVLYVTDTLTVLSAGLTIIMFSIVGVLPGLVVLRGAGRPVYNRELAVEGRRYGRRVWLTLLASQTNGRLDQLMMTRLVSSSELGLYAVAVNFSLLQGAFSNAVSSALVPRVAADDSNVVGRALRVMVALTTIFSAALFVATPVVLPVLFGPSFEDAVTMCQILLVAAVPWGVVQLMTVTLAGINHPGRAARGELISLAITIPLLIIFLGRYGGEAAALTSLAAYSATAAYLVFWVHRLLGLGWREMFVPHRSDLQALASLPLVGLLFRG